MGVALFGVMNHVTIIATSLNDSSNSQTLARLLAQLLESKTVSYELIDMRELAPPFAGTDASWEHPDGQALKAAVERASHVVIATPIYNYSINAVAKNMVELVGRSFEKKVVAFMAAAGGHNSYMALMSLANELMLDFRTVIVPRFLYTTYDSWENNDTLKPEFQERLERLYEDITSIQIVAS